MEPDNKGIALIVVMLIIVIIAIIIVGTVTAISGALPLTLMRINEQKALCAAQSGVYQTIDNYIKTGYRTIIRDYNIATNTSFSVNKNADFLLVDTTGASTQSSPIAGFPQATSLQGITITDLNTSTSQTLTIDKMQVAWTGAITNNLREVWLNGNRVKSGDLANGTPFNLDSNCVLRGRQVSTDNRWIFGSNIPDTIVITTTLYLTDGSLRKAILYANGAGYNNEFSIRSTGKATGKFAVKRTIEATYDAAGEITSWQETLNHI